MEDIFVQVIDMDVMIPEQVVKNQDGSYTIFLNARYSREYNLRSYQHAIEHINNGDFDRECGDVQVIEAAAHEMPIETIPAALPDPVITVAEKIKKPRKRKRRHRQKPFERYITQDRSSFIAEYCDSFALAEHRYLYGNNL